MSQEALSLELADEIRRRVFDEPGFIKVTQVLRKRGNLFRVSLRPVTIKGEHKFQGEMTDAESGGRPIIKNFAEEDARAGLEEMLAQTGARELHLITASGDLHVRVTKKGHELVSRSAKQNREAETAHDRVKDLPLNRFDASVLLRAIGLADKEGKVLPSMRGKYDQVNAFLSALDPVIDTFSEKQLNLIDCGCGRAYLTLAVYVYLTQMRGFDVKVCGIDRRGDVLETARRIARDLDAAADVTFLEGDIDAVEPPFKPDLVLSLHACDTATDAAIARGTEWHSRHILCVPCCQHELHKTLKEGGPMRSLLRFGILRERLADLLTDQFRAQILRILGYRVNVMEFVSHDATARNILLKAEYTVKPGQSQAVSEYLELRDFWQVKPWLETRLAGRLAPFFARFGEA